MKIKLIVINALIACGVAVGFMFFNSQESVRSEELIETLPPRQVYVGAWVGGFWESQTKTLDVTKLSNFEKNIDSKVAIANFFSEWSYLENPKLLVNLKEMSSYGWTPMISSNPFFFKSCPKSNHSIYKTIAMGECDEFLSRIANNMKQFEGQILLRFAWEMNLPDIWWSISKTNSSPEEFVQAWQRIHTIMRIEGAENVKLVLSLNTSSGKTVPYSELFPGDEYVDWVAIDGYNWGTSVSWSGWTSFDGVFRKSYEELTALTTKPVMLSEVSSSPIGGSKAGWFDDMLNNQIPYKYNAVRAIVFFNENKDHNEGVDWSIDSSSDTLFTVKGALKNSLYKKSYP